MTQVLNTTQSATGTFAAFQHRNYRLWFVGQLISLVGTFMQGAAQGYLVFSLTGSSAYLGYVGAMSGLPSWLFMLYGGVIADRIPRRTLMMITQSGLMLMAFIQAALVFAGVIQAWHILVLAFLVGTINAFDTPARQSFVVELVDRPQITNAIALNGTMFNGGAILGPAVGGMIYALVGPQWCFAINGFSFLGVLGALALMRIHALPVPAQRARAIDAIVEGFQYVRGDRLVATLSFTVLYMNIFAFGLITLMPAWAVNILGGDVTTNGLLLSSRGVGAVIGGLMIAALSARGVRGRMWFIASLSLPLLMVGFALARTLPLSLLLLAGMGLALITVMNNSNALVQSRVPDALRGRVMGLYSLMFMGGGPLGSFLVGQLAERFGEPNTALFSALMILVYVIAVAVFRPEVRRAK